MAENKLPPMPEPDVRCGEYAGPAGEGASEDLYTADTLRAAQAPLIERIAELERQLQEVKKLTDNWEAWAFSTMRDERNGDLCDFIEKLKAALASYQGQQKGGDDASL